MTMVRVLCPPPGRLETSVTGRVDPGSSRFTEVSSAKYMVSARNARPKGPSRPLRTVVPESATPSPFESTRRTILPSPDSVAKTAPPGPSARERTPFCPSAKMLTVKPVGTYNARPAMRIVSWPPGDVAMVGLCAAGPAWQAIATRASTSGRSMRAPPRGSLPRSTPDVRAQQQGSIRIDANVGRRTRQLKRRDHFAPDHADAAPGHGAVGARAIDRNARQPEHAPGRRLRLRELEGDALRPGVVAPGAFELGVARLVEPLPEEPIEVLLRRLLDHALEVQGESRRVATAAVVVADAAEKRRVADLSPEHMQHPGSLLVVIGVEELHEVVLGCVDDRPVHHVRPEVTLRARAHAGAEHRIAVQNRADHQVEVAREALREPEMVPVALRDGVAEPLVGGLVPHHSFTHPPLHVWLFGVEDGARVLHAAEPGRGLDVGKLLVRERPDSRSEERRV